MTARLVLNVCKIHKNYRMYNALFPRKIVKNDDFFTIKTSPSIFIDSFIDCIIRNLVKYE